MIQVQERKVEYIRKRNWNKDYCCSCILNQKNLSTSIMMIWNPFKYIRTRKKQKKPFGGGNLEIISGKNAKKHIWNCISQIMWILESSMLLKKRRKKEEDKDYYQICLQIRIILPYSCQYSQHFAFCFSHWLQLK